MSYIKKRVNAFRFAFKGLKIFFRAEDHAWLHALASVVVVLAGWILNLEKWEWTVVILCIGLVFVAELLNTAIEHLVNLVHPDFHPLAGKIKDLSAAAVLVAAMVSAISGLIVFVPHLKLILFGW